MKKMKLAVVSVVGALFLALFGTAPALATPDSSSGKVLNVAIIGDSYTAGNGAGGYVNGNADGSYFSNRNWGNLYIKTLKDQGVNAKVIAPLAYGGSVVDDLLCAQNGKYRSKYDYTNKTCVATEVKRDDKNPGNQIARIPGNTDLVMLTIGGNDVHFSDIVEQCFAIGVRDAKTCKEQVDYANANLKGSVNYEDDMGTQVSVKKKTRTVLEALDRKLKPGAEVVLVGYPLLSTDRPYALKKWYKYGEEAVDNDAYGYPAGAKVRSLGLEATKLQQEIVDEWNRQSGQHVKVRYVGSIAKTFAGHEPDPSAHSRNGDNEKKMGTHLGRWINEFYETKTREVPDGKGGTKIVSEDADLLTGRKNWYHPGITGHEKIAGEIVKTVGVPGSVRSVSESSAAEPVDVAVVVDSTGSMRQVHSLLGQSIKKALSVLLARKSSTRFASVSYRDRIEYGADYVSRVDSDFTTDINTVETSFNGMSGKEHAKDGAQSTVYSGVAEALNLDWRVDARKIAIVVGDAPARDPEEGTGYTADKIARLSAEAGGVEIYAIDTQKATKSFNPSMVDESMKNLVRATGGKTYEAATLNDIPVLIDTAVADSLAKPSAWLQGPIGGYTGEVLDFDARGSYSTNGEIVKYEWDFDGDGTYDQTTTSGTVTRSFDAPVETTARVRVTDEAGYNAIATAPVYVTVEPAPLPEVDISTLEDKPGVYEVLDEEAIALFPELAPVTKDATVSESGESSMLGAVKLPVTGVSLAIPGVIAGLTIIIGLAIMVAIKRKRSQK